jgi:hypothetical protein
MRPQEKRYRSMQEHIRRAHPEYYIPKLPATKESFELMITTPPHELPQETSPQQQQQNNVHHPVVPQHSDPSGLSPAFNLDSTLGSSLGQGYGHILGQHDGGYYTAGDSDATAIFNSMQAQQRSSDEYRRGSLIPAASAAAALAQLQYHRGAGGEADWAGDNIGQVIFPTLQLSPTGTEADFLQNFYADHNHDMKPHNYHVDPTLDEPPFMQDPTSFPATTSQDQPGLLPSSLARSPTDRSNILAPLQRSHSRQHARPRTKSLTQQARMAKHERKRSRDNAKRNSGDRKAFSNEPTPAALYGKRWEDLIDAATSATEEEGSRDLTPVSAGWAESLHMHTTHVRLTLIDTRLAISITTSRFTNFSTTQCICTRFTIPIIPSFTSKSRSHATARRCKSRPTTVHLG